MGKKDRELRVKVNWPKLIGLGIGLTIGVVSAVVIALIIQKS